MAGVLHSSSRAARAAGGGGTDHIAELIETGWNLIVFAEGTRSRDGRVGLMRSGAAVLAARHGRPIVPVHVAGTYEAMAPGRSWMARPQGRGRLARHELRVNFGAPIHVGSGDDRLEAMERARLFMAGSGADTTPEPKLAARRAAAAANAARLEAAA